MSLFRELKRRNVFRVAALYLALSWLILQATDVLTSLVGTPGWLGRTVVALLAIGFPITLVVSWLFELTAGGLVRESTDADDSPLRRERSRRYDLLVIGAACVILAVFAFNNLMPRHNRAESAVSEPVTTQADTRSEAGPTAIAVLPFVNLSSDPEQEYLADGITEEILNLLANVQGLRVTSRTSAFTFKGQVYDLPTIGRTLGVNHIVEGSVRKSGNRVRVTAQLIDAGRDAHIWSETYDRELDDVFAIQSDVAAQIARVLNTAMSTDEASLIGTRPTESLAAWQSFLAARIAYLGRTRDDANNLAMSLINESIEADPGFARARSLRAVLLLDFAQSRADLAVAREEAQRVLELAPQLGEPRFVLAQIALFEGELSEAEQLYRTGLSHAPNSADGRMSYARFLLSAGYRERAWSEAQRAAALDPLSPSVFWSAAFVALVAGQYEAGFELTRQSRENGWTGWQPDAIEGGFAMQLGEMDKAEAHYLRAMPQLSENIKVSFDVIRNQHIDAASRAVLDRMGSYGPPGAARWNMEVLAGDLDAAYKTAREHLESVAPQPYGGSPGSTDDGERRFGNIILSDWWISGREDFRRDPRFVQLMRAVGLMDFWRDHGWPDLCEPDGDGLRCN